MMKQIHQETSKLPITMKCLVNTSASWNQRRARRKYQLSWQDKPLHCVISQQEIIRKPPHWLDWGEPVFVRSWVQQYQQTGIDDSRQNPRNRRDAPRDHTALNNRVQAAMGERNAKQQDLAKPAENISVDIPMVKVETTPKNGEQRQGALLQSV